MHTRKKQALEALPEVGDFIAIPAWKTSGMVVGVKPSENPGFEWDVIVEQMPDDPKPQTYRLNRGQFVIDQRRLIFAPCCFA